MDRELSPLRQRGKNEKAWQDPRKKEVDKMAAGFLTSYFSKEFGIDLGTANCLVYERNKGLIIQEPSVVAVKKNTNQVLAVGEEARRMIGRTPGDIVAIRPLREGVIANFDLTKELLRYLIRRACRRRVSSSRGW